LAKPPDLHHRTPTAAQQAIIGCLALLVGATFGAPSASAQTAYFPSVSWQGNAVATCLYLGSQCGKPAADKFCQLKGHAEAVSWSLIEGIGDKFPTMTLGDQKTCSSSDCDAFLTMTCKVRPSISAADQPAPTARAKASIPLPRGTSDQTQARRAPPGPVAVAPGGPRVGAAKLVTTSATLQPAQPAAGQKVVVHATVQNQGGMPSPEQALLVVCAAIAGQPKCPSGVVSHAMLPGILAGQSHQAAATLEDTWQPGKYQLAVGTDVISGKDFVELELVVGAAGR
jgi:hypothetical protein